MRPIRMFLYALLSATAIAFLALPFYAMRLMVTDIVPKLQPVQECDDEDATEPPLDPLEGSMLDDGFTMPERDAFIRRQLESTVSVFVDNYSPKSGLTESGGTGVIIDANGTVLTALHVVDDAEFIQIGFQRLERDGLTIDEFRYVPMRVWKIAKSHDVALLKPVHEGEAFPPPMPCERAWVPTKDQLLWHFGKTTRWSRGLVGSVRMASSESIAEGRVEVRAAAYYGDSGGPVVTPSGNLVGIVLTIIPTLRNAAHFMPLDLAFKELGVPYPAPVP